VGGKERRREGSLAGRRHPRLVVTLIPRTIHRQIIGSMLWEKRGKEADRPAALPHLALPVPCILALAAGLYVYGRGKGKREEGETAW